MVFGSRHSPSIASSHSHPHDLTTLPTTALPRPKSRGPRIPPLEWRGAIGPGSSPGKFRGGGRMVVRNTRSEQWGQRRCEDTAAEGPLAHRRGHHAQHPHRTPHTLPPLPLRERVPEGRVRGLPQPPQPLIRRYRAAFSLKGRREPVARPRTPRPRYLPTTLFSHQPLPTTALPRPQSRGPRIPPPEWRGAIGPGSSPGKFRGGGSPVVGESVVVGYVARCRIGPHNDGAY